MKLDCSEINFTHYSLASNEKLRPLFPIQFRFPLLRAIAFLLVVSVVHSTTCHHVHLSLSNVENQSDQFENLVGCYYGAEICIVKVKLDQ